MILKSYKPDGSPDLHRWVVVCDRCDARHVLHDMADWLVPIPPEMPDYCPACEQAIARGLITAVFGGAS